MKSFQDATKDYRQWLSSQLTLINKEWKKKEKRLAESTPFEFLRATFYRWAQWWPEICSDLDKAPCVLGVGDLHVENFGTWRDVEGRLVWGINDFDECCCLPYTNDLVRLATSAYFAIEEQMILSLTITELGVDLGDLKNFFKQKLIKDQKDEQESEKLSDEQLEEKAIKQAQEKKDAPLETLPKKLREKLLRKQIKNFRKQEAVQKAVKLEFPTVCKSILLGYCAAWGLNLNAQATNNGYAGRKPFILAEDNDWLRDIVIKKLSEKKQDSELNKGEDSEDDFDKFFQEMHELDSIDSFIPKSAWEALNQSMPKPGISFSISKRDAGFGSLGRQRFTAVVKNWQGGILVREAKALAPSAWLWARQQTDIEKRQIATDILYEEILAHAVRSRDPWVFVYHKDKESWIVRRLAPDAGKVKLKDIPKEQEKHEEKFWQAMGWETANVHVLCGDVPKDLNERNKNPLWLYQAAKNMAEKLIKDWEEVYTGE